MQPVPNDVDWSATAAWIALAISITGTILGPIVTTILTNRHQIRLHRLSLQEKLTEERNSIIQQCISCIGSCSAYPNDVNQSDFGKHFFAVYTYVPVDQWELLDKFYCSIIGADYNNAHKMLPQIIHLLASLLKESPPTNP